MVARILYGGRLPLLAGFLPTMAAAVVGTVIAASLSFLGLGSAPPAPEWGYMLNSLRGALYDTPLVAILPGS